VEDVRPVANKFLQIMQKQAMDKNDEVSQAYARAAAYIVRVVSDSAKDRFCDRLLKAYLEATEETRRQKVADVVLAWGKVSPDHFTAHETQLLPFSYLGLHDTDEYTSKIFKEVWSQHAGSSRTVIRYVPEIVALVEKCLDTTQWPLRHAGAFTVASMVSDVADASEATGQISEANLKKIWPVFDQVLAVKTFPGKEKLLESFPKFVEKGHELWKDDKIAAQMKKIAIREAKRNNDEYRVHAFACLWKFAEAREDLDMLQEIADIVKPYMDEHMDEDKMDVDSKGDIGTNTAKNGFEAIARGYNHKKLQSEPRQTLSQILSLLDPYLSSIRFSAIKREVWYKAVYDMLSPFSKHENKSSSVEKDEHSLRLLRSLDLNQAEAGTEAQRIQRVKAVSAALDARAAGAFGKDGGEDLAVIKEEIEKAAERERSLKVQQEWKDCKKKI
jgi:proteasome component ECM29